MSALLLSLGYLFMGTTGLLWSAFMVVALLVLAPQVSPRWVMQMQRARPLRYEEAPRLYETLRQLAQQADLDKIPTLYWTSSRLPNAYAVGTKKEAAVAVTQGLLDLLDLRELRGVLAHEVGHIQNNDLEVKNMASIFSRVTTTLSLLGRILLLINLPLLLIGQMTFSWWAILLLLAAPSLSMLLQAALSRTREYQADLVAARLTGDPAGLASALRKLDRRMQGFWPRFFFSAPVKRNHWLDSHPATQKRIARLEEMVAQPAEEEWLIPEVILPTESARARSFRYGGAPGMDIRFPESFSRYRRVYSWDDFWRLTA
jgi:heat shock protein HtpX